MTRHELRSSYFDWMYELVADNEYFDHLPFRKLLIHLNSIPFAYSLPMDSNRETDGIDLRYRFGYEKDYDPRMIASYLDDRPCTVFEMMVALSNRCEEQIMSDPEIGDRTGLWFWNMLVSLGLDYMTDNEYDEDYIDTIIDRFLNREYNADGSGGLFTIENCSTDLRNVEIWYQMNWYLDDIA